MTDAGGTSEPREGAAAGGELRDVLLFIADISGYTRFMRANWETIAHSQIVITILLESILERIRGFGEVSKLEGDAVFFFSGRAHSSDQRQAAGRLLLSLVEGFQAKVTELAHSRYCDCEACRGIDSLRLKVVVHAGKALVHRVGQFEELAGLDVILVHRLLKNSAPGHEYVLVTRNALEDVEFDAALESRDLVETVDTGEPVATRVFYPREAPPESRRVRYRETGAWRRVADRARWTLRVWFGEIGFRLGLARRRDYRNLSPGAGSRLEGIATALLLLLATPLTLPYTLLTNSLAAAAGRYDPFASAGGSDRPDDATPNSKEAGT